MSSETKWTKGPWSVGVAGDGVPGYVYCDNDLGSAVAICYGPALPYSVFPREQEVANAQLIASAPKLYEALAALTDWHEWSLEQSERAADEFYRETGFLAPYKDASAQACATDISVRRNAWSGWYGKKNNTLIAAARTAIASARGES